MVHTYAHFFKNTLICTLCINIPTSERSRLDNILYRKKANGQAVKYIHTGLRGLM